MNVKGKKVILPLLGIVVIGLLTLLIIKINSKQGETVVQPPLVKTLNISASNKASEYVYSGEVLSRYESQLAFQVGGKVVKKNVEVGDTVKQGTVLLELDSRDIQQAVNNYAASVAAAQAKYKLTEENLKRFEELYQEKIISQAEYDNDVSLNDTARAALDQANALYAQGLNQLGYCKLYADKSGAIGSVDAEEGQVVAAGQKLVTLVQNSDLEVEINVPENRIDQVKKDTAINVGFWALPGVKVKGAVREVSPIADKASRTYKVRISLVDPPPAVQIGMSSNVSIDESDQTDGKIWIPLAAVYQQASSPGVWVVKDDAVSLKPVTIADFNGDQVAVSAGLKEGDVVVTAGVTNLREGQKVRMGSDNQ